MSITSKMSTMTKLARQMNECPTLHVHTTTLTRPPAAVECFAMGKWLTSFSGLKYLNGNRFSKLGMFIRFPSGLQNWNTYGYPITWLLFLYICIKQTPQLHCSHLYDAKYLVVHSIDTLLNNFILRLPEVCKQRPLHFSESLNSVKHLCL